MNRIVLALLGSLSLGWPLQAASDRVVYLTDLEGSRIRLQAFFASSRAFRLGSDGRYHLHAGWTFVYGGDSPDRFYGAREVVSELLRLKRETPDRVILISGNRDINKIRLRSELARVPPGPARVEELKRILAKTMGAPRAFEFRHRELGDVSEDQVVESYLSDMGPQGDMTALLFASKLAYRSGETLFLHGGITRESLGYVPGRSERTADVDQWIVALNEWYLSQMQEWSQQSDEWDGVSTRAEEALIQYQMPAPGTSTKRESVVYGRNVDAENMPVLPEPEVIASLLAQGIRRLVIGHTPSGDAPVILRTAEDLFEVISADNSYSDENNASSIWFRGLHTHIRSKVKMPDGRWVVLKASSRIGEPSILGRRVADGSIVIGSSGRSPIGFRMKNFQTIYTRLCAEQLLLADPPIRTRKWRSASHLNAALIRPRA